MSINYYVKQPTFEEQIDVLSGNYTCNDDLDCKIAYINGGVKENFLTENEIDTRCIDGVCFAILDISKFDCEKYDCVNIKI